MNTEKTVNDAPAGEESLESTLVPLSAEEAAQQAHGGGAPLPTDAPIDGDALLGIGEAPKKRLPMDRILIVGVVVVAAGVLFGMRQIGVAPRTSMAVNTSNLKLADVARPNVDHSGLLADLGAARTSRQVPTDKVQKNPFVLMGMVLSPQSPVDGAMPDSLKSAREERERLAKAKAERAGLLQAEFKSFELAAVIGGSQPVARINNKLYKIGDKVGKFHTLKDINSLQRRVELEADGQIVTLAMEQADGGS